MYSLHHNIALNYTCNNKKPNWLFSTSKYSWWNMWITREKNYMIYSLKTSENYFGTWLYWFLSQLCGFLFPFPSLTYPISKCERTISIQDGMVQLFLCLLVSQFPKYFDPTGHMTPVHQSALTLLPEPSLLVRVEERVHQVVAIVFGDLEWFFLDGLI